MDDRTLDRVLAYQAAIAWAGEGRAEPPRLGWWATDLVDPKGGGDLFARLTPRTARWAALEAAREAARRTDAEARRALPDPDASRTVFFLGDAIDERLRERWAAHKREGAAPENILPFPVDLAGVFDPDRLASALAVPDAAFTVVPGGRRLDRPPAALDEAFFRLAACLVPFAAKYPMPFFRAAR